MSQNSAFYKKRFYGVVCYSFLSIKEGVNLVRPMQNKDIGIYFPLNFLKARFHSTREGFIWKYLSYMVLYKYCCHLMLKNLLILLELLIDRF